MGCGLNCTVAGDEYIPFPDCEQRKIAVWPDHNYYFKLAIHELIFKEYPCYLAEGVVFVDFSLANFMLFMKERWLALLASSGMSVILVADREMYALANYWLRRSSRIKAVIISQEGREHFKKNAKRSLYGRACKGRKFPVITQREMRVMSLLLTGRTANDISDILQCSIRSVRGAEASLRKKFGGVPRLGRLCAGYCS
ncbi:helix-turn-helix transcriptional regulator [Entomohabitans teleogrylli]|uniref:helix-turn-helix transcriptional regulator n=1 Tax=Entomohabitans teleogrylli TaxID=1384589 RepID=UPI0013793BF7|nr:LuxR C-terminal-related transcriptional regulator [Entomohabitans teleogrylli]